MPSAIKKAKKSEYRKEELKKEKEAKKYEEANQGKVKTLKQVHKEELKRGNVLVKIDDKTYIYKKSA